MIWLSVVVGIGLLALVLIDIILTLFTPSMRGRLNSLLVIGVWWLVRPVTRRSALARELAGPLAFISVVMLWAVSAGLGWALIYWPFLSDSFLVDFGLGVEQRQSEANLISAIYFSFVVLATLGFGDIVPTSGILRMIVVSEALVGLGLLTASISWFLSIDPALARRRLLTHEVLLLRETEQTMVPLAEWDARTLEETLNALARGVMMVRSDVLQFPITYYFRHANPDRELSDQLPYLLQLARSLRSDSNEQLSPVDIRAALLERAVLDFMGTVGELFLPHERDDPAALMQAYLRDHAH